MQKEGLIDTYRSSFKLPSTVGVPCSRWCSDPLTTFINKER